MIRSTTKMSSHPGRATTGGRGALAALLTLVATLVAITIGAGSAQAAQFGSKLNKNVQPSNSVPSHHCDANPGGKCTWVMGEAYGRPGGEESPKTGYLRKVKLIAGEAGKFKLQVVKTKPSGETKVVRNGPKINYQGQTQENWDDGAYRVEKFKTRVKIKKGQRLAIKTKETSALRCSSGGPNTLLYTPPLKRQAGYSPYADTDGCWMLIEGKVK
jgi:hypothetical protein